MLADTLSWDQIRLFLAIMRSRTLADAGQRLRIDSSTVSRRLARLEQDLDTLLFDRTYEGLLPTAAAENLFIFAEEVELSVARFTSASRQVETEVEGLVRLTAPPGVVNTFLSPLLPELLTRHPKIHLELDASIGYADLTRREADLALRTQRPTSGELIVTRVVGGRELPMASPAYASELGSLETLSDARWLSWSGELSRLPGSRWLHTHAPEINPVLRSNHVETLIAAAQAGLGALILPEPYILSGLVPLAYDEKLESAWLKLPSMELWLVAHKALRNVPRVSAVWEFFHEKLSAFDTVKNSLAKPCHT